MRSAGKSISICIPTHNRAGSLSFCLDGIAEQAGIADVPLIVVNNNCTDNTDEVIMSYKDRIPLVRVIHETGVGNSYARNRGLAEADTSCIAYLDDDTRPDKDWLAALKRTFETTNANCVAGRVKAVLAQRRAVVDTKKDPVQ